MRFGLRETVFIVLLMVIPIGAWWSVFRPQNAENAKMRAEIEVRQAKLRQLNEAMGTIGDLKTQIEELGSAIDFFQSKLPDRKEIDKILKDIWRLAEENKLHTESIKSLTKSSKMTFLPADSTHGEQPIAVSLKGDFVGLYSFLLALENRARIMRIRSISLEQSDKTKGIVKAKVQMSIFFETQPNAGKA